MSRAILNGLAFPSVATLPAAASNVNVLMASAGALWFSNGTVWLRVSTLAKQAASVATSAAINTTETYISPAFQIPANDLYVGAAFRITVYGTCTSTVANVTTLTVRLGTAGTTADTSVLAATCTAAASGTAVPFRYEAILTVRSIGAGGTAVADVALVNSGVTGISAQTNVVTGAGTTAAVNTTVANFLGVSLKTAASTTTHTVNSVVVEQIA